MVLSFTIIRGQKEKQNSGEGCKETRDRRKGSEENKHTNRKLGGKQAMGQQRQNEASGGKTKEGPRVINKNLLHHRPLSQSGREQES